MSWIQEADARQMLDNNGIVDEIVAALVSEETVFQELADDVAEELEDILEDDPTFRNKIVEAATSNPEFKESVITHVVAQMAD